MSMVRFSAFAAAILLLQGCASILEGTDQTITVETTPQGANCRFYREGRVVAQVITPGGVMVEKTKHDMTVECVKEGYEVSKANLDSGIEGATWGNIVAGGGIGWAIDSASGADNEYPEYVNIALVPKRNFGTSATLIQPQVPWIWHSINNEVPAYAEYGGGGSHLMMPTLVGLRLIRQQGEWGVFEYEAQNNQRSQGWILMANVERRAGSQTGGYQPAYTNGSSSSYAPSAVVQSANSALARFDGKWVGAGTLTYGSVARCGSGPKIETAILNGAVHGELTPANGTDTINDVLAFDGHINEDGRIQAGAERVQIEGVAAGDNARGTWVTADGACDGEFQLTRVL